LNLFDIYKAQSKAWSILSRSFKTGRVASTYLFHGKEGLGQWPLAISFAALVNCPEPVKTSDENHPFYPCGECRNCRNIFALNYEGLHFVVPVGPSKKFSDVIDMTNEFLEVKREEPLRLTSASTTLNVPIDMAREVKKKLSLRGGEGVTRVAVFYRMELMLTASADALLKLIEEPPPNTIIILTADRPESLLPTIQSRSQCIKMDRVSPELIATYLKDKYEVSEKKAMLLARISEGMPGRAVEMIETDEDDDNSGRAIGFLLFKSLFMESAPGAVSLITEMVNDRNRSGAVELLRLWQSLIRDCAYHAVTDDREELVNIDFAAEIPRLAGYFSDSKLAGEMTADIKNTLADFRVNVHIQSALVALALKLVKKIKAGVV